MPVNDQERSLRRRIVFKAMNGNATPAAIQTAIRTLDNEFGEVENLRFNQLIDRLRDRLDSAEANLSKVLGNIMTLRTKSADEIGPDPLRSQAAGAASKRTGSAAGLAATRREGLADVFGTLVESVVSSLRHRGDNSHQSFLDEWTKCSDVQALAGRVVGPLTDWAADPQPDAFRPVGTVDHFRILVHAMYLWLCEKFGPVDADRMLNQGVRAAEGLPAAVTNPPRQLL
ncbi:MAG: hypothetical protein AAF958_13435 [Planctomycetota bacterium]